jgi:RNA polymerase sigma-70 factor (ECF subfamily)
MSWTEVTELVLKAQKGDREAYGSLVERFQGVVYATTLTRVKDPGEAQEVTQEVFVHGMRKIAQLRDPRCFAGWLRRIAARMAINRLTRKGLVRGAENEFLDSVPGKNEGPLETIERDEAKAELHEGLKQLKPLDRQTLEAFYLRGRSLKQMSREFETPVGTIKRRLHVARLRLKDVMETNQDAIGNDYIQANRPRRIGGMNEILAI